MVLQILAIAFALCFFLFVLALVKRRALREEYSLLWLALALGFFVLALFPTLMDWGGQAVGIFYGPAFLFLIWLGFVSLILLNYAVVLSHLREESKNLVQENALLRHEVEQLKGPQLDRGADPPRLEQA